MSDTPAAIQVYGAPWCPDCRRSKKFLSEHLIRYEWIDIDEDPAARALVEEKNNGKRIIPTIIFPDGSFVVEPSNAELAQKLGLQTKPLRTTYDLVIIGGGPGGLTAALYAAREGVDTLVIEKSALGGQAGITAAIENFPGFPDGLTGAEFAERLTAQARRFGVELLQAQEVQSITPDEAGLRTVTLADGTKISTYALLIASGASYKRLGVPGEEDLIGAGVHYCATCDGPFYKGQSHVVVIGGGNSATEESLHLLKFVDKVHMLVRGPELTAGKTAVEKVTGDKRIEIHYNVAITELIGKGGKLKQVVFTVEGGAPQTLDTPAAFVFIGQQPNTVFLNGQVMSDERGFLVTGHDLVHHIDDMHRVPFNMETSLPGIFAAGDVRHGSTKQIASAVGEGASAAIAIREFLKTV
jgi:thioredoxin reductase (NADPH)